MKIIYISASIIPSKHANSVHVMKMCQAFGREGHDVSLIATAGEKIDPYEYYNVDRDFKLIQTYSFKRCPKFSFINRLLSTIKYSQDADIFYTRWLMAAMLLIIMGKKNIVFEHHHFSKKSSNRFFEKKIVQSKGIVRHVFITKSLKEAFFNVYPVLEKKDVLVLPDGADIPCSKPYFDKNKKKITCGYIGSFKKGKGVETVVKIAERIPTMLFHIIGGTENEIQKIKSNTKTKNIIWHGFLDQKKAMNVLKNDIDIALLPNQLNVYVGNERELDIGKWTSPMKMFEYMSMGKIIIASNIPVLKEILIDKENALLVHPVSIDSWVEAIIRVENNWDDMIDIRKNAYRDLIEKYNWSIRSEKSIEGLK